jgi:hypothetical protein
MSSWGKLWPLVSTSIPHGVMQHRSIYIRGHASILGNRIRLHPPSEVKYASLTNPRIDQLFEYEESNSLNQLSKYQLYNEDHVPWGYLSSYYEYRCWIPPSAMKEKTKCLGRGRELWSILCLTVIVTLTISRRSIPISQNVLMATPHYASCKKTLTTCN